MTPRQSGNAGGDEALLAAVTHPPRLGEARPISAILPQVLACYGLAEAVDGNTPAESVALTCWLRLADSIPAAASSRDA